MKNWWHNNLVSAATFVFVSVGAESVALAQDMHPVSEGLIYDALMGKKFIVKYSNDFQDTQSLPMDRGIKGSNKPLGVIAGPKRIEFSTSYTNVDPKTVSAFAEGLHAFIVLKKGGWENFQKAEHRQPTTLPSGEVLQPYPDAFKVSHVSYDDMLTYARDWWHENSFYTKESGPLKDQFLYEAILDGIRNYNCVECWDDPSPSTDHIQWCDVITRDAADKL